MTDRLLTRREAAALSGANASTVKKAIVEQVIPGHILAARIAAGESDDDLDEDFPHVPAEAREFALQYARKNPRRGRPRWSAAGR